ncbi:MAG: tetratricopeptide repeat protein [Burkholderiales bacterium]|nr:tetratricopeptide repeat protein [Burkholderiales bacterium]
MATQLDLQEQEQLDALKAFWKQQGSLITWTVVLVLGALAAWNGWQYWQGSQASRAADMFEQLDKAAGAGNAELAGRIFDELRSRYPRTAWAEQGALTVSQVELARGRSDAARAALGWLGEHAVEPEMRTVARLRLAAVQADAGQYAEVLKTLDGADAPTFAALVEDRRGDALLALGRKDAARTAYQAAYQAMDERQLYRRLVEAKLMALGAAPAASGAAPAVAATGSAATGAGPAGSSAPTASAGSGARP